MHSRRPSHSDLQKPVTFRETLPVVAPKEKVALIGIALAGGAGCLLASTLGLGRSWTLGVAGLSLGGDLFYLSRATWKEMEEIDRLATELLSDPRATQQTSSPRVQELIYKAWTRKASALLLAIQAPLSKTFTSSLELKTYRLELLKLKAEQGPLQGTFLDFFPELKTEFGGTLKGVKAADVLSHFNPASPTISHSTRTNLAWDHDEQEGSSGDHSDSEPNFPLSDQHPSGTFSHTIRPLGQEDDFGHLPMLTPISSDHGHFSFSTPQLSTDFFRELMKRKGLELPEQHFYSGSSSSYDSLSVDARSAVLIDQLLSYNPQTKQLTLGDSSNLDRPINHQIYSCLIQMLGASGEVLIAPVDNNLMGVLRTIRQNILFALANQELNLPGAPGSKEDHFGLSIQTLTYIIDPFNIFGDGRRHGQPAIVTVGEVNFDLDSFSSRPELLALLLFCPERTPKGFKPELLPSLFSDEDFKISSYGAQRILNNNRSDWSYRIEGSTSAYSSSGHRAPEATYDARVIIAACLPESGAAAIPPSVRPLLDRFRETHGVHLPTAKAELASFFPAPGQVPGTEAYPFHFEPEERDEKKGIKVTSYFVIPPSSRYETEPQKVVRSVEFFANRQLLYGTYYKLDGRYSSRADQVESRGGSPGYGSRQFFDQDGNLLYRDTVNQGALNPGSRSNSQGQRLG